MEERNRVLENIHDIYIQLIVLCFTIFFIAILCLFLKIGINTFVIPISYCISVLYAYIFNKKEDIKQFLIIQIIIFLIIASSLFIAGRFYDISWDGTGYHQNAIIKLNNGWNPIYEKITGEGALWNNYYGKYSEIVQSCILSTFKQIEMGKSVNIIFMIVATLYSIYILLIRTKFGYIHSLIYGLLIGLNPVSVYQFLSFYQDGILASVLIICGCVVLDLEINQSIEKYMVMFMIGCIGVNVKFTLVGYIFTIGGMYVIFNMVKKRKVRNLIITASMIMIVGMGVLGFNPYMINLKEGNHIFYPLMGSEKVDIISYNQPKSFSDKVWIEKFLTSVFSESDNINEAANREPKIKIPFSTTKNEIEMFKIPDVRIAGWGPLFSGMLLAAIIVYVREKYEKNIISIFLAGILLTVLINPEAWWARYTPQFYLIPIIIFVVFSVNIENSEIMKKSIACKTIEIVLILICTLNIGFVSYSYLRENIRSTKNINAQLMSLKQSKVYVYIKSDKFETSCMKKLQDNKIDYEIVSKMDDGRKWEVFCASRGTVYFSKLD